ncbi:MAG: hypothetical protein GWN93_26745 [Deltaproteobacteria bacterium]|nr:hypothetical protein [Deltaproteobacteria bacterium]
MATVERFKNKGIEVEVVDRGWNLIVKQLDIAHNSYAKIGVLQKAGMHDGVIPGKTQSVKPEKSGRKKNPITIAHLATIHEFGVQSRNIPERPFMKIAFDSNRDKIFKKKADLLGQVYDGRLTVKKALKKLGLFHEGNVKAVFRSGKLPALKQSTIKAKTVRGKRGTTPLIDTGQLRQSIASEVVIK